MNMQNLQTRCFEISKPGLKNRILIFYFTAQISTGLIVLEPEKRIYDGNMRNSDSDRRFIN